MQAMGESCPFSFNFDPDAFKVGDTVSYRVGGSLEGMPFVGTLIEVHERHVIISADAADVNSRMHGTRESRPFVEEAEALK